MDPLNATSTALVPENDNGNATTASPTEPPPTMSPTLSYLERMRAFKPPRVDPRRSWPGVTLFVYRDCQPPYNPFHCLTAIVDTFQTMVMLEIDPSTVRAVFLDTAPAGKFELMWRSLVGVYVTHDEWSAWGEQVPGPDGSTSWDVIPRGAVVPTSSFIWSFYWTEADVCPHQAPLLLNLRRHYYTTLPGLIPDFDARFLYPCGKTTRITFVVRVSKRIKTRRVANAKEFAAALREALPTTDVLLVDPGALSFEDQVALMRRTDVLVGMHGGALTNLLFLKTGATVVELHPFYQRARCYDNLARWAGVKYLWWRATARSAYDTHESDTVLAIRPLVRLVASALGVVIPTPSPSTASPTTRSPTVHVVVEEPPPPPRDPLDAHHPHPLGTEAAAASKTLMP